MAVLARVKPTPVGTAIVFVKNLSRSDPSILSTKLSITFGCLPWSHSNKIAV